MRKQNLALIALIVALVILLIVGFYRSVTHQDVRPEGAARQIAPYARHSA